jgi:hypothetical protein
MLAYIETSGVIKDRPELNFLGTFTTVAVTNGVSNILHADKEKFDFNVRVTFVSSCFHSVSLTQVT